MGIVGKVVAHSINEVGQAVWARTMHVVDHFLESGRRADRRLADRGLERRGDEVVELTLILFLFALPPTLGFLAGRTTRRREK